MHPNWKQIDEKWPAYRVCRDDVRVVDVSACIFFGEGKHEFAVYSFVRYLRQAEQRSASRYPICVRFAIHFPDHVLEEEPAIVHLRAAFPRESSVRTGMVEPAQLLAVIACSNGPAFWDALWSELSQEPLLDDNAHPSVRWVSSNLETVLCAAEQAGAETLPPFVGEPPPKFPGVLDTLLHAAEQAGVKALPSFDSCEIGISADDVPIEQFSGYEPDDDELNPLRSGSWHYEQQLLKKGVEVRHPSRERVVLKKDLRRLDESLYKGQLGWTEPDTGFTMKPGEEQPHVTVTFDSGAQVSVDVYWIDFLREECAQAVAAKIVESFRNTPFDADPTVAAERHRDLPFGIPSETKTVGQGLNEVYAYSYASCMDEAALNGDSHYPMKIGYTKSVNGAMERIYSQFPGALADDVRVLFVGRCNDGHATEKRIHANIGEDGRKIAKAPGEEWFATSASEIEELFLRYC